MYDDHCRAIARANSGNVLERYLPRELRTNSFGFGYSISATSGGRFLVQYSVFFVYLTPNHDGHAKKVGGGKYGTQSPTMCHDGLPDGLHFCKSHENALCPSSRNALHSACDSSHAISTFSIVCACACGCVQPARAMFDNLFIISVSGRNEL